MNISQMSAFQAVMTSASLSDAAKKLGRTQPAVSAAIKTLEEQLGLQLFLREGRKLVPVPEAQYLLTETTAILSQMKRVRQTMKSLADGQSGALQFAAMPGPVSMLFPRFIADQIEAASNTSVSILARSSSQIAELQSSGASAKPKSMLCARASSAIWLELRARMDTDVFEAASI
ncbi:MAG: LysR family transcriptional regulator [Pseudomonadota bacterium]